MTLRCEVSETHVVAGDEIGGDTARYFTRPSLTRGWDGAYYSGMLVGNSMTDASARLHLYRSAGDCKTWRKMTTPSAHDEEADPRYSYLKCHVTQVAADKLLAVYIRVHHYNKNEPLMHPETDGFQHSDVRLTHSLDGGRTWARPRTLDYPHPDLVMPQPCMVLPDKTLAIPCEIWHEWDKGFQDGPSARLIFSDDGGESWPQAAIMAGDPTQACIYGDPRITTRSDGRMIALFWKHDLTTSQDLPVHRAESADNGRTWRTAMDTGLTGQIANPWALDEKHMLCVYQERFGENVGVRAAFSSDSGRTWDQANATTLWGVGQHVTDRNPFSGFQKYAFGTSSLCPCGEREAWVCFWHSNGNGACVRVLKLTVALEDGT